MNFRRTDDPDDRNAYRALRHSSIGTNSVAAIFSIVMGIIGCGGAAYTVFSVRFQTEQNAKDLAEFKVQHTADIAELKSSQSSLWASRNADKDTMSQHLTILEGKMDILLGRTENMVPHQQR